MGFGQHSISILSASILLCASGHPGDGELVVGAGKVVPLDVAASGAIAIVKLRVCVINVVALAFGVLAGSVAPVALALYAYR